MYWRSTIPESTAPAPTTARSDPPLRRFPREGSTAQTGDFSIAESPLLPRFTPSGFVPVLPKCCPLCPSRTLSPGTRHGCAPAGLWASKPSETSRSRRSVESSPSAPAEPLCLEQGTAAPPPPYRVVPQEYASQPRRPLFISPL